MDRYATEICQDEKLLYFQFFMESRESCLAADGRAWKVDGRAQALVGPGLATPLSMGKLSWCLMFKITL